MSGNWCEYEDCPLVGVRFVKYAGTLQGWYCADHAHRVEIIEREWDDAEREYLEQ